MRKAIGFILVTACLLASSTSTALAHDDEPRRPSMFTYGWSGLTTGLSVGVATGYLATGPTYQAGEWRMMVTGLGVGALSGLGVGLIFGLADIGAAPAIPGYIVLRDMGFGTGLGAIAGLIVGALIAVNGGEWRDLAVGTSYGAIIGAGTGMLFGIIEAALTDTPGHEHGTSSAKDRASLNGPQIRFTIGASKDASEHVVWVPSAYGTF